MSENYYKICPNCGEKQFYTNRVSFNYAVRKKSLCGECSSTHKKKEFVDIDINNIKKLYIEGKSLSKIAKIVCRNKSRVKGLLIEEKINRRIILCQ